MTAVPRRRQWQPRDRANGLLGPQFQPAGILRQSTTLGLHPVIHVPNYMDHYSFTDPWGMDGWVGHVGWPIADGLTARMHLKTKTKTFMWCILEAEIPFTGENETKSYLDIYFRPKNESHLIILVFFLIFLYIQSPSQPYNSRNSSMSG